MSRRLDNVPMCLTDRASHIPIRLDACMGRWTIEIRCHRHIGIFIRRSSPPEAFVEKKSKPSKWVLHLDVVCLVL